MEFDPKLQLSEIVDVKSKDSLEEFFRNDNLLLHLYEIGDLDDFFFPKTSWTAIKSPTSQQFKFVALIYRGTDLPVLLAHGSDISSGLELLQRMSLPNTFYSHLSVGLQSSLLNRFAPEHHGMYNKMELVDKSIVYNVDCSDVCQLLPFDLSIIEVFYSESYPGNWFDKRMLDSMQTFGIKDPCNSQILLAVAGIHVYSKEYKVAALGNIAVHPSHRGKGLGRKVTAALVKNLLNEGVEHIGLNVNASNEAAISCYRMLGFEQIGQYEEIMWKIE